MHPASSSISPGMQVQRQCSEHSTGFQWRLGFSTNLRVSVFNVCIRTVCHHTFLTFFMCTIPLGRSALLTPLCWQFLTSLLRPLEKDLSLFLDPLSETPYHYPSEKQCFTTFTKKLETRLFEIHLCWSAEVCVKNNRKGPQFYSLLCPSCWLYLKETEAFLATLLAGRVEVKTPSSCVLLGMQKRRLEFTPVDELTIDVDFEWVCRGEKERVGWVVEG